jgi:hypothetical protein
LAVKHKNFKKPFGPTASSEYKSEEEEEMPIPVTRLRRTTNLTIKRQ